ncbi:MAG: geranylgeranylglyceryl/heptaprenylglyceryl phosphate synthase, partial [Candidatus Heimdallarchaeaceae archaeon]
EQIKNFKRLREIFWLRIRLVAYLILNPSSSAGRKVKAKKVKDISPYLDFASEIFDYFYLEGTGGKINYDLIKKASHLWEEYIRCQLNLWKDYFIYGGGIDSKEKLKKVKEAIEVKGEDRIIVIGNNFTKVFRRGST